MRLVSAHEQSVKPRRSSSDRAGSWPAVETLSITDLFGRYTYPDIQIGAPTAAGGEIALLYGENGSGKTTLLRLLYACLSPEPTRGLRTFIASTPFRTFSLTLRDGTSIRAIKTGALIGSYEFVMTGPQGSHSFTIQTDDAGTVKRSLNPDVEELSAALGRIGLELLFLHDTRRIESTFRIIREPSRWDHFRYYIHAQRSRDEDNEFILPTPDGREEGTLPIKTVVASAYEWIRGRAARQGSTGELDASLVYLQVIKALSQAGPSKVEPSPLKENLVASIYRLKEQSRTFINHGLLSDYPFESLTGVLDAAPEARIPDISKVLSPYLESISTRIQALAEVQDIVSVFESEMNSYLRDKRVNVNVIEGIRFNDGKNELDVSALSSGERQLVFLFCAALLSRSGSSLFIIDEPELSLNPTWQRKLVGSLSNLVKGAQTQFFMATHSIEILSKHRSSVQRLISHAAAPQDG
jgi:ABC-type Mn2+/Zn2+ transport system ATPase subunit